MITKLSKSTVCFFVEKKVVRKEDEEVYAYGMELLYSSVLNIVVALIIAAVTHTLFPVTAFLITFILLRQYIGGYHAKSHLGCILILTVILCCFVAMTRCIPCQSEVRISMLSLVTSLILILRFAPVDHPNKPLSKNEKTKLRKQGIRNACIISFLSFTALFSTVTRPYGMYISLGQLTASAAMILEITDHRRTDVSYAKKQ